MISDINLQNFRSYKNDSFELSPNVNIIVGPNASGKTNLLEGVLLLAKGSSYRAKDADVVQFKKPWAKIEAHTTAGDSRVIKIQKDGEQTSKIFEINKQKFQRLSLPKTLPVVLFEPNHLQLLDGGQELRRQYRRALSQRNALLKRGRSSAHQLFAWNIRLSELGAQLAQARLGLVKSMAEQIDAIYKRLAKTKEKVELNYQSAIAAENYASNLLHKLETNEAADFERGFTAYGPHRDDLQIFINKHLAQEAVSRGETRTLLLVLKVLEAQLLEQARDLRPLLLLDDVFSELDGARRQALTKFLHGYQTFITTTDADVVIQHFTETTNIIPL